MSSYRSGASVMRNPGRHYRNQLRRNQLPQPQPLNGCGLRIKNLLGHSCFSMIFVGFPPHISTEGQIMNRRTLTSVLVLLACSVSFAVTPGNSNARGNSLAEWMKIYWTWALGGNQAGS